MSRRATQARSALAIFIGYATAAWAQSGPAADVPESLRAAPGEHLVLVAHASGSQIYQCARGADGQPQWTLKAPDAELRDDQGHVIGHHSAGPSWKYSDGSEVTGKAAARVDSPDAGSIPWLRVAVVSHSGNGLLAHVTTIQRLHTHGGQPPPAAQCDAAKPTADVKVPYSADYYFYAPAS
ncbi:MAG TPA: DUF3455 domain-containing protein [Steroidobacteraceae bacterium]|nr:DUF3455 domain-containing protein [Steroidobacteraceae bacterium]